jgi:integrase/recombinase XerD
MDRITRFLDTLKFDKSHSENTIQAYIGDLKRFRAYLEEKYRSALSLGEMAPWHFTEFLESEKLFGFSVNTLQRRKMVLAQFANYLTSIGDFTTDQAEEILNWRISLWQEIYQQEVEFLSVGDVQAVLRDESEDAVIRTARDKAILSLLLETGLTISSLIALRMDQLDLVTGVLNLKTGGEFSFQIPQTIEYLATYIADERPEMIQSREEEILFISQLGGPISRQGVWQILNSIGNRLNPPVKLAPRILRNTAVKRMIEEGLSITEIQQRLGHRNIYSTRALVRKIKRTQDKQETEDDRISDDGKN